ncbi:MAG: hypothetical protein ABID84_05830 [Chloroflexota bacterium]
MESIGFAVSFLGVATYMAGGIWMIILAFRESVGCGLLYLFMPFYSLYYLFSRWDEMRKPFIVFVVGIVMLIVGVVLAG